MGCSMDILKTFQKYIWKKRIVLQGGFIMFDEDISTLSDCTGIYGTFLDLLKLFVFLYGNILGCQGGEKI